MKGEYLGVNWEKTQNDNINEGFTTITVNGEAVKFFGHKSNAQAWNFILGATKKRGTKVINGELVMA